MGYNKNVNYNKDLDSLIDISSGYNDNMKVVTIDDLKI